MQRSSSSFATTIVLLLAAATATAQPTAQPTARSCHGSAYVPGIGVVVFGGAQFCGTTLVADSTLRAWDGTRWRALPGAFPMLREDVILAYDDTRKSLLLFGGRNRQRVYSDLWEWRDSTWRRLAADGDGPPPLEHAAGAFDAQRRALVIFGGAARGTPPSAESPTWEWTGAWRRLNVRGPASRIGPSLAYSRAHGGGGILLYGGFNDAGSPVDLWRWDGQTWTELHRAGPTPTEGSAIAVSDSGLVVVGVGPSSADPWTLPLRGWIWRDTQWTALGDIGANGAVGQTITFDPARRAIVLVGGAAPNQPPADRHYELLASRWRRVVR